VVATSVVKDMPAITSLPATMLKSRLASPVTVKVSSELVEVGTNVTSPVTEPTPAVVTTTVPPVVPGTIVPKSSAPPSCTIEIGATITAVATPWAVSVSPGAAAAGIAKAAPKAARTNFFIT